MKDFEATSGWLTKWMYRCKCVYRRITSSGRNLPKDLIPKLKANLSRLQDKARKYEWGSILGFDESSFYMDSVGNYSVEVRGII